MCQDNSEPTSQQNGFSLIVVIWALAILALIAASFAGHVRTNVSVTANAIVRAKLEAAADAGVSLAINRLSIPVANRALGQTDEIGKGTWSRCRFSETIGLQISIYDETGKVDLNAAPPALLQFFLQAAVGNESAALALADAIVDFRDFDDAPRSSGAERDAYMQAGLNHKPKNTPFLTVEELDQVKGITPNLFRRLRPFFTVHSKRAGIDPSVLSDQTKLLISNAGEVPPNFQVRSNRQLFSIQSTAWMMNRAEFVRLAIVDISGRTGEVAKILSWSEGAGVSNPANELATPVGNHEHPNIASLPKC